MLGLSLLALRRLLPVWLLVALAAGLFLATRGAPAEPLESDALAQAGLRALTRQNAWSVLLAAAPLFLHAAARLGSDSSTTWMAPSPAPAFRLALALGAGCALACALATGLTAAASELAVGSAPEAWRLARTGAAPSRLLDDADGRVRWNLDAPERGERLRLWTTVALGSGPAVTASFHARTGLLSTTTEARVAGRTALCLDPPDSAGAPLELELERIGPGALLALPPEALQILAPAASERLTALTLGLRLFLLLATGCALALGLGRFLRASLATGAVLALGLLVATRGGRAELWPGGDLARAWGELSGGLVPAFPRSATLVLAVGLALLGLVLQAGARGARRASP